MNETEFENLKRASWRRKLMPEEKAALDRYLAAHPEGRLDWEEELGLNRLLAEMPDAPVPTNFTTSVLQAVEKSERVRQIDNDGIFHWLKVNWLPRIAVATLVICGGFVWIQQYERTQVAHDVATVSSAAILPPQWLEDFDAIERLSQPPVDHELLAALE